MRQLCIPLSMLLALSACATPASKSKEPAREHHDFGLPPARAPLEFPAGAQEVTLGWLVDELARLTGQELAMQIQVRQALDLSKERLELTTPVPANEVYAYVEAMLAMQGLVIAPIKSGERPVLGVYGTAVRSGPDLLNPVPIEPGEVDGLADHPALLCQVMLVFENIDSRQLQTQLRQLLVDNTGMQQVVPAGDRGLLMQATGAKLFGLARLLREVDRASAARKPPAPAQPASVSQPPSKPPTPGGN